MMLINTLCFIIINLVTVNSEYAAHYRDFFVLTGCPATTDIIKVNSKFTVNITYLKLWKPKSVLYIKIDNDRIFDYEPAANAYRSNDSRITWLRYPRKRFYSVTFTFKVNDAGTKFQIYFSLLLNLTGILLCKFRVNDNFKAQPSLVRLPAVEIGNRYSDRYFEGDRVLIRCKLYIYYQSSDFRVLFPLGADFGLLHQEFDRKIYYIYLTKEVRNLPVHCILDNGANITRYDLLTFISKPTTTTPYSRRMLAFSISALFAIVACVTLPVGTYMLIIKQRKDNTEYMLQHIKQEMRKKWDVQSKKKSRASKMSKMSRMSGISRTSNRSQMASAHEIAHLGFMRHI